MTEFALPCVVCHQQLKNVDNSAANQPDEGTAFMTYGHYGSTFFDPMDGSYLEVNICDPCLELLTAEKSIMFGRNKVRVICHNYPVGNQRMDVLVGWKKVDRELTTYNGEPDGDEVDIRVDYADVGEDEDIEWLVSYVSYKTKVKVTNNERESTKDEL